MGQSREPFATLFVDAFISLPVRDLMSLMGLLCLEPTQSIHEIKVGRQQYTFFEELSVTLSQLYTVVDYGTRSYDPKEVVVRYTGPGPVTLPWARG